TRTALCYNDSDVARRGIAWRCFDAAGHRRVAPPFVRGFFMRCYNAEMSEDKSPLGFYIRYLEIVLRRKLTDAELAFVEKSKPNIAKEIAALRELAKGPFEKRLDAVAFKKRLKARQGTIMPDFEALYKKKAELDQGLADHGRP